MSTALHRRLLALEARHGKGEDEPTIFVTVTDASIPDPDAPQDDGPRVVLGVHSQVLGLRVSIRPGESLESLQVRAAALVPSCRVWMAAYGNLSFSRAAFELCTEAG